MQIFDAHALDFYKTDHKRQYPPGTTSVYSNFTARSANHAQTLVLADFDNRVVLLGLQSYIKRVLMESWKRSFFDIPMDQAVTRYKRRMDTSLGEDAVDTAHLEQLWGLGYLPLTVKALPEGSRVNIGVPMWTVKETHPDYFWLTNYIESDASCENWKPCTTATIAFEYKRLLNEYAMKTVGNTDFVPLQAHDFSYRGMSCREDAARSGSGHLSSFIGTDSVLAIDHLEDYYNAIGLVGVSVPATEHSVMCMGTKDGEKATIKRLITETYPTGIISIVSDTWDFWHTLTVTAAELKQEILNRQPNSMGLAKVVFRPDSGDPANIICGTFNATEVPDIEDKDYLYELLREEANLDSSLSDGLRVNETFEVFLQISCKNKFYTVTREFMTMIDGDFDSYGDTNVNEVELDNEEKGAVQCLWEEFGGTVSEQGYKILNERVGLIYGDSITLIRAKDILERLEAKGFASTNIVLGIGSFTYQYLTRDTFGFAMKATHGIVNGENRPIFKDPKTDDGTKKSAKGLLRVEKENGQYVLYDEQTEEQEKGGLFVEVFRDGKLLVDQNWDDIKARIASD